MNHGPKTRMEEIEILYFCRHCWERGTVAVLRSELENLNQRMIEERIEKVHPCRSSLGADCRMIPKLGKK